MGKKQVKIHGQYLNFVVTILWDVTTITDYTGRAPTVLRCHSMKITT
jgi:hypothetical protein